MKKLVVLVFALGLFASCSTTPINDDNVQETAFEQEGGCSSPDTNCNGNPDHCDDENGVAIPGCV